MKVYVTSRFKGKDNRQEIEALCKAVHNAHMVDFNFTRDVEHYEKTFDDPKQLWAKAYDEIGACDALLIDVSDGPTGGRLVEAGMAYALRKPVIVTMKKGVHYKELFDGISATVIEYDSHDDLTAQLKKFETDRAFNITDKTAVFILFVAVGLALGWGLAQLFIPLGMVVPFIYWFIVRRFVPLLRAFDRVAIFIPLTLLWGVGFYIIEPISAALAIVWVVGFWLLTVPILRKLQFAL